MNTAKCPACEAERQTQEAVRNLDRFIAAIKPGDRAPEPIYVDRLRHCRACSRNDNGTCLSCGCFVKIRAALKAARCPRKIW